MLFRPQAVKLHIFSLSLFHDYHEGIVSISFARFQAGDACKCSVLHKAISILLFLLAIQASGVEPGRCISFEYETTII
jgi:hypothetical protein